MKAKTIDEFCGQPPGSFKRFLAKQKQELLNQEASRKARIKASGRKIS